MTKMRTYTGLRTIGYVLLITVTVLQYACQLFGCNGAVCYSDGDVPHAGLNYARRNMLASCENTGFC